MLSVSVFKMKAITIFTALMITVFKDRWFVRCFCLLLFAVFLASCSSTRNLKKNEYLLNANIIDVEPKILKSQLAPIIKQKPNRKIFGFIKFHTTVYNLGSMGKVDSAGNYKGFNRWLMNTVGEAPVVLDTFLTKKSAKQLKQYLQNIGYFNAIVKDTTIFRKNKKADVIYRISAKAPYRVQKYEYLIFDKDLKSIVINDSVNANIKKGDIYSVPAIQKEKERVAKLIRNAGYYYFSQQYISFSIDSSFNDNKVVVYLNIDNPDIESTDSTESAMLHQRYYFNDIYVIPDYDLLTKDGTKINRDTFKLGDLEFLYRDDVKHEFKLPVLEQHIFLNKDSLITQNSIDLTYRRLQDLGVFRFVNIGIQPLSIDTLGKDTLLNRTDSLIKQSQMLDCYVNMTPTKMQDYAIENEVTTSGGNIGIAGSISYRHKNIFRGTELLELKVAGSISSQPNYATGVAPENQSQFVFNTFQFATEARITFHQFLFPFHLSKREKSLEPITRLVAGFSFEDIPEYKREISSLSLSYVFKTSDKIRMYFYPIVGNYVIVNTSEAYQAQLDSINDEAISYSYTSHFVPNGKYSITYNNQYLGKIKNILFLRFNFEYAGNLFYLGSTLTNAKKSPETGNYQVFGVDYAQYIRPDVDFRYYQVFNPGSQLVYRLLGGYVLPYGNTKDVLFEKAFYSGGSNDIRAFAPYNVGVGGYQSPSNVQSFGEIKIGYNLEYRFNVYKLLKGAVFVDGGNVWLNKPDENRPLANFSGKRFLSEFALGAGLGARFDFTFFVFRVDAALPIKDPTFPEGERYVIKNYELSNFLSPVNWNIGIGYPF